MRPQRSTEIRLGLRANWPQFALLVLVNVFVGGMVGLERTVLPLVGSDEFGITSRLVGFSFIIAFGVTKALVNLVSGALADRLTRKVVLVTGWLIALPIPFLLAFGPNWGWIIAANVLLGASQGLTWSMTVTMKIDLVGPSNRGLAMGLNEAAGYGALGLTALLTGYVAARYGLRPEPFLIGIPYAVVGLLLSALLVRDTRAHARLEAAARPDAVAGGEGRTTREVFALVSWRDPTFVSVSQAGMINNLNDGMSWAVFPLLFAAAGVGLEGIGLIKAVYPVVWGVGMIATGPLSDRWGRKPLIVSGLLIQALGHVVIGLSPVSPLCSGLVGATLLGIGTALVYPALLAAVGDRAHPSWRATALGVYRFWRDLGYAVGASMAGVVAGLLGLIWSVHVAGLLTLLSGLAVWRWMHETRRPREEQAG